MKQCLKTWLQGHNACNVKGLLLTLLIFVGSMGAWADDLTAVKSYMIAEKSKLTVGPKDLYNTSLYGVMYLVDKDDKMITGITVTGNNFTTGTGSNAGLIACSNNNTWSSAEITVGSDIDLTDGNHKLVVLTSANAGLFTSTNGSETTFDLTKATAKYECTLVSKDKVPVLQETLGAGYDSNTTNKNLYVKTGATSVVLTNVAKQLEAWGVLGTPTYVTGYPSYYSYDMSKPFYMRVTVKDNGGNVVSSGITYKYDSNGNSNYTAVTGSGVSIYNNDISGEYTSNQGLIYCYQNSSTPLPDYRINYQLDFSSLNTDGSDFDIKNYTIECVFSREKPSISSSLVTADPTLMGKIVFTIKDGTKLPFAHYEGIANKSGDYETIDATKKQLRQKTHEFHYYYYVDPNTDLKLILPFESFDTDKNGAKAGNDLEPQGYIRWYDYNTDQASSYLKAFVTSKTDDYNKTGTLLHDIYEDPTAENKVSKGLFAYKLGDPNVNTNGKAESPYDQNVGVVFNTTSKLEKEVTIACDVSRYIDGMDESKTFLEHEPTLSIRYIFHIKNKEDIADAIKNALVGEKSKSTSMHRTYEDNRKFTVGLKGTGATATIRLNLNAASRYWFYPMSNIATHHVYTAKGSTIVSSDFTSDATPVQASKVVWRVYDRTKSYYTDLQATQTDRTRFYDLQLGTLNAITAGSWKKVSDGQQVADLTQTFTTQGDSLFMVAYLSDANGSNMCPVANFDIYTNSSYPLTKEQLEKNEPNRLYSYLDAHYTNRANVTFDNDEKNDGTKVSDLSAPTLENNMDWKPSKWGRRSYGFVYQDLMDYDHASSNGTLSTKHRGSQHGEYGFYKSANLTGVSTGNEGYYWWASSSVLYDKTYENTNGQTYGKFMYIDASDESRDIATVQFDTKLCVGSQMVFSACVADMTSQSIKPQIAFKLYGVKDGKMDLLHTFSSGNFGDNVGGTLATGTWYQVYGKITIADPAVEDYSTFAVVVDNFCNNTNGADYCVDDIRIYTRTAKVDVIQDKPICGKDGKTDSNIKLRLRASHDVLNSMLNNKDANIYYKIMERKGGSTVDATDAEGKTIDYSYDLYTKESSDAVATKETVTCTEGYAKVKIYTSDADLQKHFIGTTIDSQPDTVCMLQKDDDEVYVIFANKNFNLKAGTKYYVSVNVSTTDDKPTDNTWGDSTKVCSVYSEDFELVQQDASLILEVDNKIVEKVDVECGAESMPKVKVTAKLNTVDQKTGGSITLSDILFDWYLDGTSSSNKQNQTPVNSFEFTSLAPTSHTIYLKVAETTDQTKVDDTDYIKVVRGGKTYYLCANTALDVNINVSENGPKMSFGFADVNYPENTSRIVRIGLPQITALKNATDGGYLEVPVAMLDKVKVKFVDAGLIESKTAQTVYLTSTDDPTYLGNDNAVTPKVVATLRETTLSQPESGKQATLGFNLHTTDADAITFHEGYQYEVMVKFNELQASTEQGSTDDIEIQCPGKAYLTFQIVPEYLDWNPTAADNLGTAGNSANWNNDANWIRSERSTLYKEASAYANYDKNSTETGDVKIDRQNTYVPMAFCKVTVPDLNGEKYFPYLNTITYAPQTTGATTQIAQSLADPKSDAATTNIEYAIMADWDETNSGVNATSGNMACVPFYGNTCQQIYFKPRAELMNQQYLVYQKAWVEKELTPDTWELLTSPLKDTYAGDMYVPVANGRQETPAFTDITYNTSTNNRVKYAFSQRSWDKSDVKEYKYNSNSSSASDYTASETTGGELKDQTLKVVSSYWSHTYNDLAKAYTATEAVAIKAGNAFSQAAATTKVLVRLPKADTSYKSYNYKGEEKGSTATLSKTDANKLQGAYSQTATSDNAIAVSLSNSTTDNGYFLVGNPYMASISAYQFIDKNGLASGIAYYENGTLKQATVSETSDVVIAPMQSFFVQKKADQGASIEADTKTYQFTASMAVAPKDKKSATTDGDAQPKAAKKYTLSARKADAQLASTATVVVSGEASEGYDDSEDVTALCDNELNATATVYTVADAMAVGINSVPSVDWMPMGVIADGNDDITLSLEASDDAETLYLYDAKSKTYTELSAETEVSVKANEHGRYFISRSNTHTGGDTTGINELTGSNALKAYSPSAGLIVVTATTADLLQSVKVYSAEGKLVDTLQANGELSAKTTVSAGAYIVKAKTESGKMLTKKLAVR